MTLDEALRVTVGSTLFHNNPNINDIGLVLSIESSYALTDPPKIKSLLFRVRCDHAVQHWEYKDVTLCQLATPHPNNPK